MASNIKLKNLQDTEFSISHSDGEGAVSITSSQLNNITNINLVNIVNGTLPTSDPLVAGQLWSNSGVVTVSAG